MGEAAPVEDKEGAATFVDELTRTTTSQIVVPASLGADETSATMAHQALQLMVGNQLRLSKSEQAAIVVQKQIDDIRATAQAAENAVVALEQQKREQSALPRVLEKSRQLVTTERHKPPETKAQTSRDIKAIETFARNWRQEQEGILYEMARHKKILRRLLTNYQTLLKEHTAMETEPMDIEVLRGGS